MFSSTNLNSTMRTICSIMETPVVFLLLALIAVTIFLIGSLIVEYFTGHRRLKVELPQLIETLHASKENITKNISDSGLLNRHKELLIELTKHSQLDNFTRESLAVQLLHELEDHYDAIVKISETIIKVGPTLGLLGTLIPLGPGLLALGQGDTYTLSQSLLVAFDTTILGLLCAGAGTIISTIRMRWYENYGAMVETLVECVLEVEKND